MSPLVSVIIPTHNRPDLVPRALRSVLNQTFSDYEIIVVDDGLEKRAKEAVLSVGDDRIRYIAHSEEKGGAQARNTGIEVAKGKYVAFLDDDDEWREDKLKKQAEALEGAGEEVALCFCGLTVFDETGKEIYSSVSNVKGVISPLERLLERCFIWTSAIMIKTKLREEGLVFDPLMTKNQEWDLMIRIAEKYKFYSLNESLVRLNVLGEDAHMGGKKNLPKIIKGHERLLEKHQSIYHLYPQALARRYFELGLLYEANGEFSKSRHAWLNAWNLKKSNWVYAKHALVSLGGEKFFHLIKKTT